MCNWGKKSLIKRYIKIQIRDTRDHVVNLVGRDIILLSQWRLIWFLLKSGQEVCQCVSVIINKQKNNYKRADWVKQRLQAGSAGLTLPGLYPSYSAPGGKLNIGSNKALILFLPLQSHFDTERCPQKCAAFISRSSGARGKKRTERRS